MSYTVDDYDYDDSSYCPECGEPMQSDMDGDGVMTMSYEFCETAERKTMVNLFD